MSSKGEDGGGTGYVGVPGGDVKSGNHCRCLNLDDFFLETPVLRTSVQ